MTVPSGGTMHCFKCMVIPMSQPFLWTRLEYVSVGLASVYIRTLVVTG